MSNLMNNSLFDDLVSSMKEAGAIKRKEIQTSRVTELELPDIKEVREKNSLKPNGICSTFAYQCENATERGNKGDVTPLAQQRL